MSEAGPGATGPKFFHGLHFGNLRGDAYGGITAAVVALPLALAFGVASGAGAIAGLYGAIFVGFFAAIFGGTPAQVSGPTGPMTVVMAAVLVGLQARYGPQVGPAMAFGVVALGGLFQILLGAVRLGRLIDLVPASVLSGFMTGVGCIITIIQLGPLLGHAPEGGTIAAVKKIPDYLGAVNFAALGLGALTLAIVFFLPRRIARIVPATLVALLAGTLISVFFLKLPPALVIGDIPTGIPTPKLPPLRWEVLPDLVLNAWILALLGAIDSLLTSLIHDNVTRTYHKPDRELIGQGLGNFAAGLFGGIPGAGATMRTLVNIRSGGRTPLSGALHAILLLALVLGLAPLAAHIPLAVLAGILIKVGYDVIDWPFVKRVHRMPRAAAAKMLIVLALTVFWDLIVAVAVGMVLASLIYVKNMADYQLSALRIARRKDEARVTAEEAEILDSAGGRIALVQPAGPLNFGSATALGRRLAESGKYDALVVDLTDVPLVDGSVALALEELFRQAAQLGRPAFICGVQSAVATVLDRLGAVPPVGTQARAPDRMSALRLAAAALVERQRASHMPGGMPGA